MLNYNKTFSSFSTNDLEKTKDFYGNTLGIEVKDNPMGILELHMKDGAQVMIYPKDDHQAATFTVLNFLVDDIENRVDELTAKGIKFEQYDMDENFKTDEKGIMKNSDESAIAWFKDPAGNVLSLVEEKK